MDKDIQKLQKEIYELSLKLGELQRENIGSVVENYSFKTLIGTTTLSDMFGQHERLMLIHNMGQGCQYCTLWADGFNGFLPHLESAMSVVLVSKDSPTVQRDFANSRGWRFRLASHEGGAYIKEQTVMQGQENYPGVVVYERKDGKIWRKNSAIFGPGDQYCSMWNLLSLAGLSEADWVPKYQYWQPVSEKHDGCENQPG